MAMHLNRTTEKLCHRSGQVNMKDFLKRSVLHHLFPILSYHFNFRQYNDYILFISRCCYFTICFNRFITIHLLTLSVGGGFSKNEHWAIPENIRTIPRTAFRISEGEGGFTIMEFWGHGGYLRFEIRRHGGIPQVGFLE